MDATVRTVVGTGRPGYSETQINNPFGLVIGPDGGALFLRGRQPAHPPPRSPDRPDQRPSPATASAATRATADPATRRRDEHAARALLRPGRQHLRRRARQSRRPEDRPARRARSRRWRGPARPASAATAARPPRRSFGSRTASPSTRQGDLLICDIGNHRVRRLVLATGIIDTYAGTGEREPTPDGAPIQGTPLNGPRTIVVGPDGSLYLALREGNAIYRLDPAAGSDRAPGRDRASRATPAMAARPARRRWPARRGWRTAPAARSTSRTPRITPSGRST